MYVGAPVYGYFALRGNSDPVNLDRHLYLSLVTEIPRIKAHGSEYEANKSTGLHYAKTNRCNVFTHVYV